MSDLHECLKRRKLNETVDPKVASEKMIPAVISDYRKTHSLVLGAVKNSHSDIKGYSDALKDAFTALEIQGTAEAQQILKTLDKLSAQIGDVYLTVRNLSETDLKGLISKAQKSKK